MDIDWGNLSASENPMFEVYKYIAAKVGWDYKQNIKIDLKFFKKLKNIITKTGFNSKGLSKFMILIAIAFFNLTP